LLVRVQQPLDRLLHDLTHGRATASSVVSGLPVVMLTTTGARTGRPRTLPVLGFRDGERLIVVASNYGRPHHPAWYHNLRVHPDVRISVSGVTRRAVAAELTGDDRDRAFRMAVRMYPGFGVYEERARPRRIPVIQFDLA
jgi:deazaflavin-dependent oxidoreductase (nitroreductase family)